MPFTDCKDSSILIATPRSTFSGVPPLIGTVTVTVSEAKAGKPSFFTVKAVNIPAAKMVSIRIFDTTELEANQVMSGCFSRGDMMVTGKSIPWALLWLYQR